jgi:WhiB family redox-sensing transcriptional regulator
MDTGQGGLPFSDQGGTTDWRTRAACSNGKADPELFFPRGTGPEAQAQEAQAKRLCCACQVMVACRDWAQEIPKLEGVWGGRTLHDREVIRSRRRQRARAGSAAVTPAKPTST